MPPELEGYFDNELMPENYDVWDCFSTLTLFRQSGFSVQSIPYTDLSNWMKDNGVQNNSWFVVRLKIIDSTFIHIMTKKAGSSGSTRPSNNRTNS